MSRLLILMGSAVRVTEILSICNTLCLATSIATVEEGYVLLVLLYNYTVPVFLVSLWTNLSSTNLQGGTKFNRVMELTANIYRETIFSFVDWKHPWQTKQRSTQSTEWYSPCWLNTALFISWYGDKFASVWKYIRN